MVLRVVDFPAPFAPIRVAISPLPGRNIPAGMDRAVVDVKVLTSSVIISDGRRPDEGRIRLRLHRLLRCRAAPQVRLITCGLFWISRCAPRSPRRSPS
jgi:hypothetical protein